MRELVHTIKIKHIKLLTLRPNNGLSGREKQRHKTENKHAEYILKLLTLRPRIGLSGR